MVRLPPDARLDVSREGAVAFLVLRNPPENRLTKSLVSDLAARVAELEKDDGVRAVLVTGEGDFCSGLDLAEWGALSAKEAQDEIQRGFETFWALEHMSKPTIAAISGRCEGAGAELALVCDLRIASESATFAFPQVELGWMPSHGGTARLTRIVGRSKATELFLTGKHLKALDALRFGIVDHLTPPGEALNHAKELAKTFAMKPRAAVRAIKRTLTEGEEKPYRNRFLLESQHSVQLLWTDEYREAITKARGKRP
ncbi:MAG: enoyl-CoA hydratase-related protein [Thermoplasmata archaeon]